ncbi:MAG: DUF5615 family PIN-like protein [Deltaproteobacteria bacterium]|nr:DUF5615 family PIN-like protein [Deltaproteobacteria bacterium]
MKVWVDAQMSPALALWLRDDMGVEAAALRDVGLRDAQDSEIFFAARTESAVVMTKDDDFVELVRKHGPPPQILWVRLGNTSTARLKDVIGRRWSVLVALLDAGEPLVELTEPSP